MQQHLLDYTNALESRIKEGIAEIPHQWEDQRRPEFQRPWGSVRIANALPPPVVQLGRAEAWLRGDTG
jgi:hypothetical protein